MATLQKQPQLSEAQAEQRLYELLGSFDFAMLVSGVDMTRMHARPMAIADVDAEGALWFLSGRDSQKVFELERHTDAMAVMQGVLRYVCITGRAEIVDDRNKVRALWKDSMRAWFDGPGDPQIVLIRLRPNAGEYWDNSGIQGVRLALRYAKAVLGGDTLRRDQDDTQSHAKLNI